MINENLRERMNEATRALMSRGAAAATEAIQKALRDLPQHGGTNMPPIPPMPDFMRGMDFNSGQRGTPNAPVPEFVSE
jgi:hypothetical protein